MRHSYIAKGGRMYLRPSTLRSMRAKVRSIDVRLKGKQGMTKSGRVIKNPQAYVFGGVRRQLRVRR